MSNETPRATDEELDAAASRIIELTEQLAEALDLYALTRDECQRLHTVADEAAQLRAEVERLNLLCAATARRCNEYSAERSKLAETVGRLQRQLREYASQAYADVGTWGEYADEYARRRWGLRPCLEKWRERAS